MQFGYAWAFWFLAAAGPIVALYLMRRRIVRRVVPCLRLWDTLLEPSLPRARLRSLRRPLSLLVQLLLLVLLVAAASHPRAGAGRSIILLDASAGMSAVEADGRTRFEIARQKALDLVAGKGSAEEMMILSATATVDVLAPFTAGSARLVEAIETVEPTRDAGDIEQAVSFARELPAAQRDVRIYVLSDSFRAEKNDPQLVPVPVGRTDDNVGIVRFAARRILGVTYLYAEIRNYSSRRRSVSARIHGRSRSDPTFRLVDFTAELEPGASYSHVYEVDGSGPFQLTITEPNRDALAADNSATVSLGPERAQNVLLVSEPGRAHFVGAALAALREVDLTAVTPRQYREHPERADVTIFNNVEVSAPPEGNVLYLNCTGERLPVEILERPLAAVKVNHWDRSHPVNRFISYGGLRIRSARRIRTRRGTRTLVSGDGGPLITLTEGRGFNAVYVGFDPFPGASDFPFREAFPLFLANLVGWFGEEPLAESGDTLPPSESAIAPAAPGTAREQEKFSIEPWVLLCSAALGLFVLEWVLFHKGVTE